MRQETQWTTIFWEGWTALALCAAAVFWPGSAALGYPAVLWPGLALAAAVPVLWAGWWLWAEKAPLLPEEDQPSETQIIHFPHQPVPEEDGKPAAETAPEEVPAEEKAPEQETAEQPQGSAEPPEPQEAPKVSLERIMNDTVSSVLEEQEDGILEERPPLREVLRHWWEKLTRPRTATPIPQDTEIFFIHARLGSLHHFVNLAASVVGYFCQLHFPDITGNGCLRHRKALCVKLFCQLFLCLYVISADQIQDLCVSVDLHPSFPPTGHSSCFSGLQEN